MSESFDDIDNVQFDVLKEIGNIGAGNATTALSQIINQRVDMEVPVVNLLELQELPDIVGGAENILTGILFRLHGELDGMIMFVMERESSRRLLNLLFHTDNDVNGEFSEMDRSALMEIGNMIVGAYLSSLSSLTNLLVTTSVPSMAIDMAGAILSVPAIEFGKLGDCALLIQSRFRENDIEVDGYFILIPTLESYDKIMKSIGM